MQKPNSILIDKKSKTGILMLHGFSSTPRQFKELSEFLSARGFSVYAPTIAGHGTSIEDFMNSNPEDWKKSAKLAYLRLRKRVKKIIIIGNSFGSNLGFWLSKELNNEPAAIISLGAPVFLRWQRVIEFRLKTYGKFRKYYRKPERIYKTDYTDMKDDVSYRAIPVKCLIDFLRFIKYETMPNLNKITAPILIANANRDRVIHPKSAAYIFSNIASQKKEMFWFDSNQHGVAESRCKGLFEKIYSFIQEIDNIKN